MSIDTTLPVLAKRKNLYDTSCKECVFATYEEHTQTGCRFGRVEKFRQKGVEVVEAMDEEREFFVIRTRCHIHRHKKSPWAMKVPGRDRMQVARDEVEIELHAIIVMLAEHTVEDVKKTVDSLLVQTVGLQKGTIVVNRDGIKPSQVRELVPEYWRVQFIMEREADGGHISVGRCVDHAVDSSTADYYAVFSPGYEVPNDYVQAIDRALNDDLERFVLLEPNEAGQGLLVQLRIHNYYGGNAEAIIQSEDAGDEAGKRADSIIEKVRHRARAEGNEHLIKRVEEICPSMGA